MKTVGSTLGAIARPGRVYVVTAFPKTCSGKIVRRALQVVAKGRDPGDISTMEDQSVLAQILLYFSIGGSPGATARRAKLG